MEALFFEKEVFFEGREEEGLSRRHQGTKAQGLEN